MLFELGQIVATPGALRAMDENAIDARSLLRRHANGDWGCVPQEDQLENQRLEALVGNVLGAVFISQVDDKGYDCAEQAGDKV